MIEKIKQLIETQTSLIRKKAGVFTEDEIECAIDEEVVDCEEIDEEPYVGIPAPAVLSEDEWFGSSPVHTEKQEEYILQQEATERLHQDMRKESGIVESEDIHQVMYEMATKNSATTLQLDPIGGSENFQGGSENVHQ